jgi:hypothetical protein
MREIKISQELHEPAVFHYAFSLPQAKPLFQTTAMRPAMFRSLAVSASLIALGAPALAQSPLEKALAAPAEGPLYAFDLTLSTGDLDAVMRVDPSRPEGDRLRVVSPEPEDWTEDFAKRVENMKANTDGDIWCQDFAEHIPAADAELVSETDTTATYSFQPQPGAEPDDMDKIFEHLTGTVVVDKTAPGILNFEMVAEKPFKPMAVAKIRQFEMKVACTRAPDGRTHVASLDVTLAGSAMMKSFSQSDRQRISNLTPIPNSGTGSR